MKISVIHASRNRPQQAYDAACLWHNKADGKFEYILSLDKSDTELKEYEDKFNLTVNYFGTIKRLFPKPLVSDNHFAVEAFNEGAKKATGDILIAIGDDIDCPAHWDTLLLNALAGKSDFIAKTKDGIQAWIIVMPILDRAYYNRFGYIYPPQMRHMFADTWITHVADLLGRKIDVDLSFPHNHYTTKKTAKDALNDRNNLTWADGQKKYLDGIRNNFGLSPEDIKGSLNCDKKTLDWINEKLQNG